MVVINSIVHLSVKNLIDFGFTQSFIDKQTSLGNYESTYGFDPEQPNRKEIKLIPYTSIPEQTRIQKNIPSHEELLKIAGNNAILEALEETKAEHYNQAFAYFQANPNTYAHARELAEQGCWLLFLSQLKPSKAKNLGFATVDDLLTEAIKRMAAEPWQKWKCNNLQTLRRKQKPFKKPLNKFSVEAFEAALGTLVHGGVGNSNREKLGHEQQSTVFNLYADGDAKPTITQVYQAYIEIAKQKIQQGQWTDRSIVGITTLKNFLSDEQVMQGWWKIRHGKQAYRGKYEIVTKRQRASFANAMWIIDGTPCHLYYRDGKNAYARLNVFVVIDAHSWCVLGFYVSDSENHEQVIGALHAACTLTNYVPHQIQSDNGRAVSGYYGRTCINAIAKYYTPATPGNARSKAVESFFKHFNSSVARFYPGFTHSPVMGSNINSKPNPEALQKQLKEKQIQGFDAAIQSLHEMFSVWNHKAFNGPQSPLEKYKDSVQISADRQRKLTEAIKVEAFYQLRGELKQVKGEDAEGVTRMIQTFVPQTYEYTNEGIEIQIDNTKHSFITDDPQFNMHIGKRFCVRVERNKPDHIYLYEKTADGIVPFHFNGRHMRLTAPYLFAQALVDRREGEGKMLAQHLDNKKLQEQNADHVAQRFIETTLLTGTYMKLTANNAFPKEVLTAAKQQIAEAVINGSDYKLTQESEKYTPNGLRFGENEEMIPVPNPVREEQRHSVSMDRFGDME